ncbi:Transcription initiation factor TFIID subunit 5 [Paramuricea clavata]|uniref:Transcription initiation factor TFIID subunit 5 n=1 Tax=Paramuricea clavata TaxID=317549 RepID=A0A6S7ID31_PARCT|nr:Transcription initiation factor TFIID subunit 5 [Paramuricea clavata]
MAANSAGNVKKEQTDTDKQTLLAVLQFLKKQNLKGTEEALRREVSCTGIEENIVANSDISSALSEYSSEGDPTKYEHYYTGIQEYIEKSLDVYKPELGTILYPLFVHMYLDLIYQGHEKQAKSFLTKFRDSQEDYYQEDILKLASVTHKEHVEVNDLMLTLRSNKFVIKLSRESYQALKKKLQENQSNLVLNLIQQHLQFDVFDGRPRSNDAVTSAAGAVVGEPTNEANKGKVLHGIAQEPDLGVVLPEDDPEDDEEKDKPKKKKAKKEGGQGKKKKEFNPDAPKLDRVPFPDLKDREKVLKATMLKETAKMLNVDGETLPSVCLYTFLNAHQG